MVYKQNNTLFFSPQNKGVLFLAFPPLLLIAFVVGLLVTTILVCIKFTKGPASTKAFTDRLRTLQLKFDSGKTIHPEKEREEMERLQNKIKTTSEAAIISGNSDLRHLLYSICQSLHGVLNQPSLENRTSWIKLNAVMVDFDTQYFGKNT